MKKLVVLLFGILLLSGVLAMDSMGIFKQNEIVRVTQTCPDATYINISSISHPNSSNAVENIAMTYIGNGEYYYLFNTTSQLGRYDVRGISDGCELSFATYFEITTNGSKLELSQSIILLGYVGFIALLFIIGFSFSKERWKLRMFFFSLAIGVGILMLNTIKAIASTSREINTMADVGMVIGIIVFAFMILWILVSYTLEIVTKVRMKKQSRWEPKS